jgi:hypothetical protein
MNDKKIEFLMPSYSCSYAHAVKEDLEGIVNDVYDTVNNFYQKFDVCVDRVQIKPHLRDWSAKINFISNGKNPYCMLSIETTQMFAAFIEPSKRSWEIALMFMNVPVEMQDKAYLERDLSLLQHHSSKEKKNGGMGSLYDSIGKIEDAICTNSEWIDTYYSFVRK